MAIHFFLYFCTVTIVHYEMIKPLTMKKELIFLSAGFMAATLGFAGNIHVKNFRYAGPMMIKQPIMVDSMDVNKKKFGPETVLNMPVDLEKAAQGKLYSGALVPTSDEDYAVHLLQFQLTNTGYAKANISVGKLKNYQIFVDGNKRASVIFANHYMISHGLGLIIIPENHVPEFKKKLVAFYESADISEISDYLKQNCLKKMK